MVVNVLLAVVVIVVKVSVVVLVAVGVAVLVVVVGAVVVTLFPSNILSTVSLNYSHSSQNLITRYFLLITLRIHKCIFFHAFFSTHISSLKNMYIRAVTIILCMCTSAYVCMRVAV